MRSAIVAVNGWIWLPSWAGRARLPWPTTIFDSDAVGRPLDRREEDRGDDGDSEDGGDDPLPTQEDVKVLPQADPRLLGFRHVELGWRHAGHYDTPLCGRSRLRQGRLRRLGVYADLVYRRDAAGLSADRAFVDFVTGLPPRVDEVVLFGRLDPNPDATRTRSPPPACASCRFRITAACATSAGSRGRGEGRWRRSSASCPVSTGSGSSGRTRSRSRSRGAHAGAACRSSSASARS